MRDESNLKRTALLGIALGFALGILLASLSVWWEGYSRMLIVSLILSAAASILSWLARLAIVGRLPKDVDPPLPEFVWAIVYFLTALHFGLFCVFVPALGALITGLILGWNTAQIILALVGILLLVALIGTTRHAVVNLAIISNRAAIAKSRLVKSSDI